MSGSRLHTDIQVWHTDLGTHGDKHLDRWSSCLSKEEKDRAVRFIRDADRRRFVIGRGVLRILLGKYLDRDPAELSFLTNPYGKPFLPPYNRQKSLHFNLSHSGNKILLAFTSACSVGIDVEKIDPDMNVLDIAHRFFADSEYQGLLTLPEEERNQAFFRAWTRKEACIKAAGKGFAFDPSSFQEKEWSLIDIDCGTGYKAAVATSLPGLCMRSFIFPSPLVAMCAQ